MYADLFKFIIRDVYNRIFIVTILPLFFSTETTVMYATAANNVIIISMDKRALLNKILSQ